MTSPAREKTRLRDLVARAGELTNDGLTGELIRGAQWPDLYQRIEGAGEAFWGHRIWQSVQPFAARAICAALAGDEDKALAHFRDFGFCYQGGSVAGHVLAGYALLHRYDRLEDIPGSPELADAPIDDDRAERLGARNRLLRDQVRVAHQIRLALNRGEEIDPASLLDSSLNVAVRGEAALACGELTLAERSFRRLENFEPSCFFGSDAIATPKVIGLLGQARVAYRRGIHALVLQYTARCFEHDAENKRALVLAASSADKVGFEKRAESFLTRLEKHHPFENIEIEGVDAISLEAKLGWGDGVRAEIQTADAAFEVGDWALADSIYSRALTDAAATTTTGAALCARALWCIAGSHDWKRLLKQGERLRAATPSFVTATEACAYAHSKLGDTDEAEAYFNETGLGRLLIENAWLHETVSLDVSTWASRPVTEALSPLPAFLSDRVRALINNGSSEAALAVLESGELASQDQVRLLVAGAIIRMKASSPAHQQTLAELALGFLLPLEESGAIGADELAPDRSRIESVRAGTAVEQSDGERLSDVAWSFDQRGEADSAIDAYLRASEAEPRISSILLANAGNLLCARRDYDRAWRYLKAAAKLSCGYPLASRASVLEKLGRYLRDQERFADAVPVCALALELAPNAERAANLAECYQKLGDDTRAQRALAMARSIEPRAPAVIEFEP